MYCTDISEPMFLFISGEIPKILYYSHIPSVFIVMLIAFFVFFRKKNNTSAQILLTISFLFFLWSFLSLIIWTNINSTLLFFLWSFFGIVNLLLFIFSFYFVYTFINEKDVSLKIKYIFLILFLPTIIFGKYSLLDFNITACEATENSMYFNYVFFLQLVMFILVFIFSIYKYFKTKDKEEKQKIILLTTGVSLFLISFFITGYYASLINNFELEQYGLFGMTIFMAFLAFLIVRFKAFNIKLLGAQALVWALIILVGSQFLYQAEMPTSSLVLTAITLMLSTIMGLLVVRSVKKVDHQRELLDIANKNQQSLLHFITHQVKGYLAKSRNIFDGMVAGDYDLISDKAKEMAKAGFASDTKGVETVMAILKASDLKTGKTAFTKEKANVSALVAEIVEGRKDTAISKGLDLSFEIEPNVEIEVDQLQIKEVFKNLITNSILYTQKGTVHVVLKREQGKVKFSVIDTGVGLSEKDKSKLFTEGGKGEESSLVNVDSTGYGLYIARQIVERHGGTIEAISEGRGKGSEFAVVLPVL